MGVVNIKKLRKKQKQYLLKKSKKEIRKRRRYNKSKKRYNENKKKPYKGIKRTPIEETFVAPRDFRLKDNTKEILSYFNSILKFIQKKSEKIIVFFDISEVEYISADSVMYMLAIMRNTKVTFYKNIDFRGNTPINKTSREVFEETGFFNYVRSKSTPLIGNSHSISIKTGSKTNPQEMKEICDFVIERLKLKDYTYTQSLFSMLMEMCDNTTQHAYSRSNVFSSNEWYVYVKENTKYFEFVFLDIGEGIPSTIVKRGMEETTIPIPFINAADSFLIESAFRGEQRTKTEERNRGKGLKSIAESFSKGKLEDLHVLSRKGYCELEDSSSISFVKKDFSVALNGTLFYWKLCKGSEECVEDKHS